MARDVERCFCLTHTWNVISGGAHAVSFVAIKQHERLRDDAYSPSPIYRKAQ